MDFINKVEKDLEKSGISVGASEPPHYWFSTGNYVLNKIISGSFYRGIPQGRLIAFTGPSGSGKSFLVGNALREAQKEGAYLVVLDSENALDDEFVSKIGVDVEKDYSYFEVDTIPQTKKVVSSVIKGYKNEFGEGSDAPKLVIAIDSLDMLMTETEQDHFEKGVTKGDQGQRNKQLKQLLREFVQAIKHLNVSIIVTDGVYKNQDVLNGEGVWIVKDAIRFSLSQVVLLTKLKLKETGSRDVMGIRMKCEGFKTRFTKPFQTVTVEVPYDTGMDPYNGLLDVAKALDIVKQTGSWYNFGDQKFQSKNFHQVADQVLEACEQDRSKFLEAMIDDDDLDLSEGKSSRKRRKAKTDEED
jgi:recombination protein RecA